VGTLKWEQHCIVAYVEEIPFKWERRFGTVFPGVIIPVLERLWASTLYIIRPAVVQCTFNPRSLCWSMCKFNRRQAL